MGDGGARQHPRSLASAAPGTSTLVTAVRIIGRRKSVSSPSRASSVRRLQPTRRGCRAMAPWNGAVPKWRRPSPAASLSPPVVGSAGRADRLGREGATHRPTEAGVAAPGAIVIGRAHGRDRQRGRSRSPPHYSSFPSLATAGPPSFGGPAKRHSRRPIDQLGGHPEHAQPATWHDRRIGPGCRLRKRTGGFRRWPRRASRRGRSSGSRARRFAAASASVVAGRGPAPHANPSGRPNPSRREP